jgi:hypothetical protein
MALKSDDLVSPKTSIGTGVCSNIAGLGELLLLSKLDIVGISP